MSVFLSLFILLQGSHALAASFQQNIFSSSACTEMSSHHHHTQQSNCGDKVSGHQSCCQVTCHCASGHCNVSALLVESSIVIQHESLTETSFIPVLSTAQKHGHSLYRPPIFS